MQKKDFFKLVCVDETDPFEYKVLVDVNKSNLDEVHEYMMDNMSKYKGKWILLPCEYSM